jgi:ferrochelatase
VRERAGDVAPIAYDAILLASFGGPEGQDDVIPFLRNVTRGRGIPEERLEQVATHYRAFGGVSPINGQNRRLKAAIEAELERRGIDLPVYWGNRNWAPFLSDAERDAAAAGRTRLIAITTSAYSSYSSCRQYREDLAAALGETGLADVVHIDKVRQYFDHPGFVAPFVEGLRAALGEVAGRGIEPAQTRVLFSTHSIPQEDADRSGPAERAFGAGGAYVAQHLAVSQAIMDAVYASEAADAAEPVAWSLVYQSRSGPPSMPWLEPDVNDTIRRLAADGTKAVVIVPVGFASDHMEVRWDLDTEAVQTATAHGVLAVRVPSPGAHPAFVAGLVDLVVERMRGVPPTERPAVTSIGPWYDVCRPGCCENVRLGFRPALAGVAP